MMFKPFLLLLGTISITVAQNYFGPETYKWHNNHYGNDYEENPGEAGKDILEPDEDFLEPSKDFLEPGFEYHTDMMPDQSDEGNSC